MPVILATQEVEIRKIKVWSHDQDPISKTPNIKQGWQVAQVVQYLPTKHKALNSKPQYWKKKIF
jgi:hypothetical protein